MDSLLFLPHERIAAHEVALLQLHQPLKIGLQWRHRVVDIVSVKCHSHLETQRIPRAEPGGHYFAILENCIPYSDGILIREIQLESVLTRVACARDENPIDTGNRAI